MKRLEIPELHETFTKYLNSIKVLVSPNAFQISEALVEEFQRNLGQILQNKLKERVELEWKKGKSWLEDWWLKYSYLIWRDPLPLNSNYFMNFDEEICKPGTTQSLQAARVISKVLEFKRLVDENKIPTEYVKNVPLCMNQFNFIFTTTRIPELNLDILKFNKSSWNLLVISQNQYFTFSLMDPRSQLLLTEEEIQIQIERILNLSSNYPKPPITPGILTCGNRNECAQARKKWLEKAPSLASLFQLVEEAPFVVCLDENEPKTTQEALCHVACGDANNRWFDKMFQLIFFKNGRAGLNGEHTPLDAPALGWGIDFSLEKLRNDPNAKSLIRHLDHSKFTYLEPPKAFELTETYDEIIPSLHSIHQSYLRLFDDLDLDFFHHSFGEKELKRLGVSPDGFVQMVLQLAYFKVHGNPCATYESAATRQFHHGRTENVRTTCPETVLFTTAMENPRLPSSFKMQTLQYALQAHRKYMVDAIQGKGCDRHLLGLRLVAIENGMPLPAIFQDKSFVAGSYFLLSTSNMPATTFTGGFGSMYNEGYGIPYTIEENKLRFLIASRNSCPFTSSFRMKEAIMKSIQEIHQLISQNPSSSKL